MGKYDITFKEIFFSGIDPPKNFFQHIIGIPLVKPLPTNLPSVKESVVDFLGEMADGSILHLEVQSTNDPDMHLRMHRYFCLINEKYPDREIIPFVLYVANKRMNMTTEIKKKYVTYRYELIDIRDIDCRVLMNSESAGDRLLSILCKIKSERKYVDEIISYVLQLEVEKRKDFLKKLFLLSELRPQINVVLESRFKEVDMPFKIEIDREELEKYKDQSWFYKEGMERKEREDVIRLFKKMNLSPEKISDVLEVPLDKVRQYLREEGLIE